MKQRSFAIESLEPRSLLAAGSLVGPFITATGSAYSIDGSGNNLANPEWGSTGIQLLRIAAAEYADGLSTPAGADRPSAREISNLLADQGDEEIISDRFLSAMIFAWGQFIDHDLDRTLSNSAQPFSVPVPTGDPFFDVLSQGGQTIALNRSVYDPATGVTGPREQINALTAWLDGSMIYGSDADTAASLRSFSGGKLTNSPGNLLPTRPDSQSFVAGDARVNENVGLTAMQTLFMREHNHWATRLSLRNRRPTDEQLYQQARAIVIAEVQAITFNQWLPALLGAGAIDRYRGYDPTVNPGIANEFSTAAFRVGHTLLGDDVGFLDDNGSEIFEEVPLNVAFLNPGLVHERGIDGILKYLASDPASEVDNTVVGSVRNFLFGSPGAGGLDLASLNIQRGRDHGLADYNSVREAYGLARVTSFAQITSDTTVQAKLEQAYGTVDNIDLWVGALAEDHVRGGSVGQTLRAIISDQFERLRDGDRFWYQRAFFGQLLRQIESTSLTDIIRRNTELDNLQQNPFFFRATISGTVFGDTDRDGRLDRTERGLAGLTVELLNQDDKQVIATAITDARGNYSFDVGDGIRPGEYELRVTLHDGMVQTSRVGRGIAVTRGQVFADVDLSVGRIRIGLPGLPRGPIFGSGGDWWWNSPFGR